MGINKIDGFPAVEEAYIEARKSYQPRKEFEWSHPIVYYAGKKIGWNTLNERDSKENFSAFKKIFNTLKIEFLNGKNLEIKMDKSVKNQKPFNKKLFDESMKYQAYLKICLKGYESLPKNCEELYDTRGPYKTRKNCKKRISEMISDLPKYKSKFVAIGYICGKGVRENLEFIKLEK